MRSQCAFENSWNWWKRQTYHCPSYYWLQNIDQSTGAKRWHVALDTFSIFFGLASSLKADGALANAKTFPCPSQVAVRRRTSVWTRTRTRWRRPSRVPAVTFCPSPMGTGPIASSQARQLPAHSKVGPDIGRRRNAAKACATKLWRAWTSRDAWWIQLCVRQLVRSFLWLLNTPIVIVQFCFYIKNVATKNLQVQ